MPLTTPDDVIRRADVAGLAEYEDVSPMDDCAGFYAFRRYPADTELARIVTADGRPAVRCYLRFVVATARPGSAVSRVEVEVWFHPRWRQGRELGGISYAQGHPDMPSPESIAILERTRKPIALDTTDVGEFLYDHQEDIFLDGNGEAVTPAQILDRAYRMHCRTLRLGFRIRWNIVSAVWWIARQAVWPGQEAAMWALFALYDVELRDEKLRQNPLHEYKLSDFRRVTESDERSHFFGFQSSRRSLLTNLVVVAGICVLLYAKAPRDGLFRAIYNNTALSTSALLLAFLFADVLGPWFFKAIISVLSRFRGAVLIVVRKVRV